MFAEIIQKSSAFDSLGNVITGEMKNHLKGSYSVRTSKVYHFSSDIDIDFLSELLCDSITDIMSVNSHAQPDYDYTVSIEKRPGVMDPEAETIRDYLELSLNIETDVKILSRYYLSGNPPDMIKTVEFLKNRYYNPLIEDISHSVHFIDIKPKTDITVRTVSLEGDLNEISRSMTLSLNEREMSAIKEYFDTLGRDPTDIELETIAQTWSEHCVHKTFNSDMEYNGREISNLFKSTIVKATVDIDHPDAVSIFHDNAGIWSFDDEYDVCFKVETHNHPSALEPYGGAGTGIGGVIRDTIGTGLGFKPIANTDVFCVGSDNDNIPPGTIKPGDVLKGITAGVRDYGNRMGIPTVNGSVHFQRDFAGNPLVYAGSLGIAKKKNAFKEVRENDMIVLLGGKTGRDGIHGATFSSVSLHDQSQDVSSGAVQIGNPIEEKKMLDAIMEADGLYSAITDCGAGGLSSAVGEMGEKTGAEVYLENVPLKYAGLTYDEIWISESQERMVLSVPPRNFPRLKEIMEKHSTGISHIGYFRNGDLIIKYRDKTVCELDMGFLHSGLPMEMKKAAPYGNIASGSDPDINNDITELAEMILSDGNTASKEDIIRQYDYEVMAQTSVKPLCGARQDSVSDSAVISPPGSSRVILLSNGINPHYGKLNPRQMTFAAIDEALRNLLAQGGNINHTALLDNYSWGNVSNTRTLGGLIESAEACRDYAVELGTPFISGKDSLNNFFEMGSGTIEIPPTLLISALSVTDAGNIRPSYFTGEGNTVCLLGKAAENELAGSALYRALGHESEGTVPHTDVKESSAILATVSRLNEMNLILSAHDLSDGGLLIALMEMVFGSDCGCRIAVESSMPDYIYLFSETQTRFIVEVRDEDMDILKAAAGSIVTPIGKTVPGREFSLNYNGTETDFDIEKLKTLWSRGVL
ncbi:MAG: phosphoribosylformylglycinamidine synthase subunit PurL [candidate division WOR-3 bacterium]|nr:phosphoribosylformylglycinamidine synthase subunit PurL [candidate division WOR-3 bacterium]